MPVRFSLVIPAFNEALRLPRFLHEVRAYLDGKYLPGLPQTCQKGVPASDEKGLSQTCQNGVKTKESQEALSPGFEVAPMYSAASRTIAKLGSASEEARAELMPAEGEPPESNASAAADIALPYRGSEEFQSSDQSAHVPPHGESPAQGYEVIVVDDGSTDATWDHLTMIARDWPQVRRIRHATNLGKGAAVRSGVLTAQGETVLFADADGAAPIKNENRLRKALEQGADIATGSRLVPGSRCRRPWPRRIAGILFAKVARGYLGISVKDPQCGFKMFRAACAQDLFSRVEEPGFLFDLEVLWLAQKRGYRIAEVPIEWIEQPGGHLRLWRAVIPVFRALRQLKRRLHNRASH